MRRRAGTRTATFRVVTRDALSIERVLAMVRDAPAQIEQCTADLTPAQLHTAPSDGEWSVNEVLAHLRSCSDVWGDAARGIAGGTTELRAVNPRTWIKSTDYPDQPFHASFEVYRSQRIELVAFLEALPRGVWSNAARVTGAGKPLQRTVHSYAGSIALHERPHLKQIRRTADTVRGTATKPVRGA